MHGCLIFFARLHAIPMCRRVHVCVQKDERCVHVFITSSTVRCAHAYHIHTRACFELMPLLQEGAQHTCSTTISCAVNARFALKYCACARAWVAQNTRLRHLHRLIHLAALTTDSTLMPRTHIRCTAHICAFSTSSCSNVHACAKLHFFPKCAHLFRSSCM